MKNKLIKIKLLSLLKGKGTLYFTALIGTSSFMFLFNVIAGYGLKFATDSALSNNEITLNNSIILMILGILALLIINPFLKYFFESIYKTAIVTLKKRLYNHIQKMSLNYYEENQSGDFISRFNNDMDEVKSFFGDRLCDLFSAFISGIGSGILLFSLSWKLALLSIFVGMVTVLINNVFSDKIKRFNKEIQEANADSVKTFSNILDGFEMIKLYTVNEEMKRNYEKTNKEIYTKSMELNKIQILLTGINCMLGTLSFIGIFAIGCYLAYLNEISIGTVLAVIQLRNGFNTMFKAIGTYIVNVQKSYASAERVFTLLDTPNEYERDSASFGSIPSLSGNDHFNVLIKDLCFSYKTRNFTLNKVNIEAKHGELVALVGPSGSGKSTLFKLMLKFYNIKQGNIFISGRDIQHFSKEHIRKMISYVEQEAYIFNGSIAENIGYGKENSTMEEIISAAKMAFADDFIKTLPQGYNTIVGEAGVKLSGGQKQRIAIARAFLKNAPILLLDEATSALDSDSENMIQQALKLLMKGRTTIVIAHRLSTIFDADRIYVLKAGMVVEYGTHSELLLNSKIYKNLFNLQFEVEKLKSDAC